MDVEIKEIKDNEKPADTQDIKKNIFTTTLNGKVKKLKANEEKKKKKNSGWDSWTRVEKVSFYEVIANACSGALTLQKIFKIMNDKIGTKSTDKIRDYYYRAYKQVICLLKFAGDNDINLKDKREVLCALNCYGKIIIKSKNKKSSSIDTMKNLNRHPRLHKKIATHLKKMVTLKLQQIRNLKTDVKIEKKDKDDQKNENDKKNNSSTYKTYDNIINEMLNSHDDDKQFFKTNFFPLIGISNKVNDFVNIKRRKEEWSEINKDSYREIVKLDLETRIINHKAFEIRLIPKNTFAYCLALKSGINPRIALV